MRVVLDHVGIAVADPEASLAFFEDVLGLRVEASEDVLPQQTRTHFLPVGGARLELLQALTPDSPVGRFLARRGPGLHHITLRVENLDALLAHVRARGLRLVDAEPRPGADGSRVAFLHPDAAHGVLVEFVEVRPQRPNLDVVRLAIGDMQVSVVHDGLFRLDGGAMFGVVPRTLWEKKVAADERNRIQLSMRPLVVEGEWGRLLIDCGAGDKWSSKEREIYGFDRTRHLDHALETLGLTASDVSLVVPTHLHFDHVGGATMRVGERLVPRFPNARYCIRRAEWEDATHPHARNKASYLAQDFVPLHEAGVVDFFDGDLDVRPGVRVERTGGHTGQHQIVRITGGSRVLVFAADLIPTTAHVEDPWIMGYDLFPVETLAVKQRMIREAIEHEHLVVFEHDPVVPVGIIRERDGRRFVEPVRYTN